MQKRRSTKRRVREIEMLSCSTFQAVTISVNRIDEDNQYSLILCKNRQIIEITEVIISEQVFKENVDTYDDQYKRFVKTFRLFPSNSVKIAIFIEISSRLRKLN